jgi:hypothetical protein
MVPDSRCEPASLADVVRALAFTGVANDPFLREMVLSALGWQKSRSVQTDITHPRITDSDVNERGKESSRSEVRTSVLLKLITPTRTKETARPEWGPLRLPARYEHTPLFVKAIDPLIEPKISRAIFGRMCSVRTRTGEIQISAIAGAIAQFKIIREVPRRQVTTLAPGLQLLIDVSPSMAPFRDDYLGLLRQLKKLIGTELLVLRSFEGCPTFGNRDVNGGARITYVPPRPGTPVLAVTDLGIVRAPSNTRAEQVKEWLDFNQRLLAQNTPLTILTPYSKDRFCDSLLARRIRIVLWDRTTGVRGVPPATLIGSTE